MAKLIEEKEMNPPSEVHSPLNGLEARAYILRKFKGLLDGRHDLFNIGKAYDRTTCKVQMTIETWSENPVTDTLDFDFADPETIRSFLTGTPVEKPTGKSDEEIKPKGKAPVKLHRGYAGTRVENQPDKTDEIADPVLEIPGE